MIFTWFCWIDISYSRTVGLAYPDHFNSDPDHFNSDPDHFNSDQDYFDSDPDQASDFMYRDNFKITIYYIYF